MHFDIVSLSAVDDNGYHAVEVAQLQLPFESGGKAETIILLFLPTRKVFMVR